MEKTTSQGSTTSLDVLDASSPSKKGSVKKKKSGGAQLKVAKQKAMPKGVKAFMERENSAAHQQLMVEYKRKLDKKASLTREERMRVNMERRKETLDSAEFRQGMNEMKKAHEKENRATQALVLREHIAMRDYSDKKHNLQCPCGGTWEKQVQKLYQENLLLKQQIAALLKREMESKAKAKVTRIALQELAAKLEE